MKYVSIIVIILSSLLFSCSGGNNALDSDKREKSAKEVILDPAKKLAMKVLDASGGEDAWNKTKYLKWNFFDARRHIWNKHTGDLVIHGLKDSFIIKMNLNTLKGEVNMDGKNMTDPDSLAKYLGQAEEMWINDGYWVFLPFKLTDPGVQLSILEPDTTKEGVLSDRLQMTFDSVGVTPQNKYIVYIDRETNHISQWDFYRKSTDSLARFSTPWEDYLPHGEIMLSSSRGGDYRIEEIAVGDSLEHYFR